MSSSFLVVRFSAIGDCVMASYVATAIRNAKPDATIVWAVETRCMAVLNKDRLLNEVVDFPRDRWRKQRWSPTMWRDQLATFSRLRRMRLDYGMDLQGHSKTAICLRIACPNRRIAAFATDGMARRLNPLAPGDPDAKHRVERMLDTSRAFGDFQMPARPLMPQPVEVSDILGNGDGPLVSIATGAGQTYKQYPSGQWEEVSKRLLARGFRLALVGASVDPRLNVPGAVDLVGKLPLEQTMAVVARSRLHLCADTGTGHIAAAYGVPFVSVFGPTDPRLFRPYSDVGVFLRATDRPSEVEPAQILAAAEGLLG